MKKLTITLLAIIMAFAFAACGTNNPTAEQNEIADLYANEEYSCSMTNCTEGVWKGIFQKEDYSEVILAVGKMTKEEAEAYEAIDFADDDAEAKQQEIVYNIADVTITDVTDKVPTQKTLDSWIGKKCKEFEDAGFYESGNTCDPDDPSTLEIFYDGPDYCVAVGFGKKFNKVFDDLSPNEIRNLTIKSIRMTALGESIME